MHSSHSLVSTHVHVAHVCMCMCMHVHVVCMQILYLSVYTCNATKFNLLVYFLQMSTFTVLGQPRWAYRWLPAVVSDLTTLSPSSTTSQLELYAISDCRLLCPCYTLSILLLLLYPHNHRPLVMCLHNHRPHNHRPLVMCLHNHRPHNHRPLVMTQLHLPQLKCYNCIWLLYCTCSVSISHSFPFNPLCRLLLSNYYVLSTHHPVIY